MKRKAIVLIALAVLLAAGATYWLFHGKPVTLASRAVSQEFLAHLNKCSAAGETWPRNPGDVALRLIHFRCSDPFESDTAFSLRYSDRSHAEVRITQSRCHDDSISDSYTVIILEKVDEGYWRPVQVQGAWKGRGRIGWSTRPPV